MAWRQIFLAISSIILHSERHKEKRVPHAHYKKTLFMEKKKKIYFYLITVAYDGSNFAG
jgi:hypothetical protein